MDPVQKLEDNASVFLLFFQILPGSECPKRSMEWDTASSPTLESNYFWTAEVAEVRRFLLRGIFQHSGTDKNEHVTSELEIVNLLETRPCISPFYWCCTQKLTYPPKIGLPKRKVLFQPSILRDYISFSKGSACFSNRWSSSSIVGANMSTNFLESTKYHQIAQIVLLSHCIHGRTSQPHGQNQCHG